MTLNVPTVTIKYLQTEREGWMKKVRVNKTNRELGILAEEHYQVVAVYRRGVHKWYQLKGLLDNCRLFDAPACFFEEIEEVDGAPHNSECVGSPVR